MKTSRRLILAISSIALLACMLAATAASQTGSGRVSEGQSTGGQGGSDVLPEGVSSDWWTKAQKDIQQSEYNISWQDQTYLPDLAAAYQAPNRAHNLRTYFTPAGIRIIPRADAAAQWELGLTLTGYGYTGNTQPVAGPELSADGHRMDYRRSDVSEWYINEESGLEQGFTIATKPGDPEDGQTAELVLEMALSGGLIPALVEEGQAVEFATPEGAGAMRYSGLQVTDAAGRKLPSRLCLSDSSLSIAVDDRSAVYPIEIDPMLTTPDWSWTVSQASVYAGSSVSTAGDVNGDGYSDIIIGAPYFDNGAAEEGLICVYTGSPTGMWGGSPWLTEGGQADARLGRSVDTAGDVNGDGYSDIIAGANGYDNGEENEGMAFVWYGSASGLGGYYGSPDDADWKAEGNQAGALMGDCVATAGDVNGDGYSDVIIGARYYDHGQTDEGMAFVYYGSSTGLVSGGGTPANANWSTESDQISAYMGYSLRTAGDVNGDGYSDVIIAAYWYDNGQTDEGRVFIWHGSSTGLVSDNGTPVNANWSAEGDQFSAYFGISVSTAGDVNGDGYADVIIGAHSYDNPEATEGRAYVYYGSSTGVGSTPWTAESNQADAYFGASVSTAGDVNGDGYADIIVGAPNYDSDQTDEGMAFIWHGSSSGLGASGIPSNADWTTEGNQAGASFGAAVNIAGDVNGDGYSDIVVGAPNYDNPEVDGGRISVYNGAAGDPGATPWAAESDQASAQFGYSVGTAGDINGDGYSDVIVGAPYYDGGSSDEGRAYAYLGSASGLSSSPAWLAESDQAGACLGWSVSTAGDVNGDGYSDVVVGARYYDGGEAFEGMAFVWYGSSSGLGASGNPSNADWTVQSDQADAQFGYSVDTAGDVNGDGYSDVIIGAPYFYGSPSYEGRAYVYYGSADGLGSVPWTAESNQADPQFGESVSTAGDVNGDGYSDVIIGASGYDNGLTDEGGAFVWYGSSSGLESNGTPANADWAAEGDQALALLGGSVAAAGDVNGDGYSDVIVGASGYSNGLSSEGMAFVWYGSSTGLGANGNPANVDWAAEGDQASAYFGTSVETAGDVNGDGYSDVIVGTPSYDNGQADEGKAFIWYGSSTGLGPNGIPANADWSAESDQVSAWFGTSVSTAGDVNGDGYSDVIVGADHYNSGQTDEGRAFVYYGNGGPGVALRPRQLRAGDMTPICLLGKSDQNRGFLGLLRAYIPYGSGWVSAQTEVKPLGTPLDGSGIQETDSQVAHRPSLSQSIVRTFTGLSPNTPYHWRIRLHYDAASTPFQQYSRWVTIPWNGWQEADLRTAPNTPPVAVDDSWVGFEDDPLEADQSEGVLSSVSDADGDSLTASLVTNVSHGSLALNSDGSFTYTPTANYNGTDSFTYRAFDGTDYSNTATLTLYVHPIDDAPSFTKGGNQIVHKGAGPQTVANWATAISAGPSDESGQLLDFIVTNDNNGLFSAQPAISASGTLTYTPAVDASGSATVTVRLHDNGYTFPQDVDTSAPQTFTITIHAVNQAPVGVADTYTVAEDAALSVPVANGVLSNDSDADSDPLKAVLVANVSHGVLVLSDDGSFTYTPAANFNGSDSFTYKVNDGLADSAAAATVTITVSLANDAPAAAADAYEAFAGIALNLSAPGLLGNDSDIDGDTLTAVLVSSVSHGTLTLNADGSFTYTAESGFAGTDSFSYKANDGTVGSATATVTITVILPEPPTIASVSESSGRLGSSLTVTITGTNLVEFTDLDFGAGIKVISVIADSSTHMTAEISIDSDAAPGTRDVIVTTPEGAFTLEDAFTVEGAKSGGAPVWIWPIVAVVVVAAGAGGFLLFRRRVKPG